MDPSLLKAQLAQFIREEYDQHPADRYPTEEKLAEHIVGRMGEESIVALQVPPPNGTGRWSISAKNDLWTEDGEVHQILPPSSGMTESIRHPNLVLKVAAHLVAAALQALREG